MGMLSDSIIALIRTVVPALIGSLIAVGVEAGIQIEEGTAESITALLIPICISAYYALVTYLERNVSPKLGWLLGQPKAPSYGDTEEVVPEDGYTGE